MSEPYMTSEENAAKIAEWLKSRGGIAIWESIDLSDPGFGMTTPVKDVDGTLVKKPHWKLSNRPARIITDPAEILIVKDVEVKRFHVGVRMGGNGFALKCTDGASRRIRRAITMAGEGAFNRFDFETQEAVIYRPTEPTSLVDWLKKTA